MKRYDRTQDAFRDGKEEAAKEKRQRFETKGPIQRVLWPKQQQNSGQRCNGGVIIRDLRDGKESSWKVKLLSFDRDMFIHHLQGYQEVNQSKMAKEKKYPAMYETERVRTTSVPMTFENFRNFCQKLIQATFSPESVYLVEDMESAIAAFAEVRLPQGVEFDLEEFLSSSKEAWARYMLQTSQLVWTFILCKNGKLDRLIDYYPLETFQKEGQWTSSEMYRLLKVIETDPYPLFFADQILLLKFPGQLPEIRLQRLEDAQTYRLGTQKLLDIWLYTSLALNEDESQNVYVTIKPENKRSFLQLASSHKGTLISHRERYNNALLLTQSNLPEGTKKADLPDSSHGDYTESLERLSAQGSIIINSLEKDQRMVHVTKTWHRTLSIVRYLRAFWQNSLLKRQKKKEIEQKGGGMDWQDKNALMAMVTSSDEDEKKEKGKPLVEEQKKALRMHQEVPISILVGPGGSGKTEIIGKLPGRPEKLFKTLLPDEEKSGEFYLKKSSSLKKEQQNVWVQKAQKLVLTPTGIAAQTASARGEGGTFAMTAHSLIESFQRHSSLEKFDKIKVVVLEEIGQWDEELLFRILEILLKYLKEVETLVMVGDYRQLEPIGCGDVLRDLLKTWIPHFELTENHRTAPEAKLLAQNAEAIASRNLQKLVIDNKVFRCSSRGERTLEQIFGTFNQRTELLDKFLLICYRQVCRYQLNLACLKLAGFLPKDAFSIPDELFVGEKICFTKNMTAEAQGILVRNGQRDRILFFFDTFKTYPEILELLQEKSILTHKECLQNVAKIRKKSSEELEEEFPRRFLVCSSGMFCQLSKDLLKTIQPGYAVTMHSLQSGSVDHSIMWDEALLRSNASNIWNEFIYSWMTRGIKSAVFITDAPIPEERLKQCILRPRKDRLTTLSRHLGQDIQKWPLWTSSCSLCQKDFAFTFEHSDFFPKKCPSC
jgi:hypothetical protein